MMDYKREEDGEWNSMQDWRKNYCKMSAWKTGDGFIVLYSRGPFGMRKLWQNKQKLG